MISKNCHYKKYSIIKGHIGHNNSTGRDLLAVLSSNFQQDTPNTFSLNEKKKNGKSKRELRAITLRQQNKNC